MRMKSELAADIVRYLWTRREISGSLCTTGGAICRSPELCAVQEFVSSLWDSLSILLSLPRTYVRGYCMSPLRGWSLIHRSASFSLKQRRRKIYFGAQSTGGYESESLLRPVVEIPLSAGGDAWGHGVLRRAQNARLRM